jgi:hypothetical protein
MQPEHLPVVSLVSEVSGLAVCSYKEKKMPHPCVVCGRIAPEYEIKRTFGRLRRAFWLDKAREPSPRCETCTDALLMPTSDAEARALAGIYGAFSHRNTQANH